MNMATASGRRKATHNKQWITPRVSSFYWPFPLHSLSALFHLITTRLNSTSVFFRAKTFPLDMMLLKIVSRKNLQTFSSFPRSLVCSAIVVAPTSYHSFSTSFYRCFHLGVVLVLPEFWHECVTHQRERGNFNNNFASHFPDSCISFHMNIKLPLSLQATTARSGCTNSRKIEAKWTHSIYIIISIRSMSVVK